MSVTWLLEPEVFQDDMEPFIKKLEELKVNHVVCQFGTSYAEYINRFQVRDDVVFSGSFQFAKVIQSSVQWSGVYCNLPQLECLYYFPRFGDYLLNADYVMLPFGALKRRKNWLLEEVGFNGSVFLRPSQSSKSFTGQVLNNGTWDQQMKLLTPRLDPETLVIAAPPVWTLANEWRTIVVGGKVLTASQYKSDGKTVREHNTRGDVLDYAQMVVDSVNYNPDPAWVLDVCETKSGNFYVIEVGSFSCSGFYACDPEAIIHAVNELHK